VVDATTSIQRAIDACPQGQVVFVPAGIYKLNRTLALRKGVVLRGAGPERTFLRSYADAHALQLGDYPAPSVAIPLTGDAQKGATTLRVAHVPSLAPDDQLVIDQIDDGIEVVNVDEQSRDGNRRSLSQLVRVTAIAGRTVSIDPPLYHSFQTRHAAEAWKVAPTTRFAGVESLSIERVSPTGTQGFSNVLVVACVYCWVRNIESRTAQFRHVDLDRSFRCEVRDSLFNDGMNHDVGGFAYGVVASNRAAANLIENNVFFHLRHSMVVKEGAAGNVFAYNYAVAGYQASRWLAADISAHGAHSHHNLFEGNIVGKIQLDFTHGSSSFNTLFRNHVVRQSAAISTTRGLRAIDVERSNWFHNIIGNVLGVPSQSWTAYEDNGSRSRWQRYAFSWGYSGDGDTSSDDVRSKVTALRHGNYDFATRSVHWDAAIARRTLPPSLYLSGRPAFWGDDPWPAIGPDVKSLSGTIPAKVRYERLLRTAGPRR
jgi:hypothetical protein